MPELFGRSWSLKVGTLEVSDLDCVFSVKKNLKPEPNTCDLKIYNLNEDSRKSIEAEKNPAVELAAGYKDDVSVIYLGQVRYAYSQFEGPDIVTVLSSGDGEAAIQQARINLPVGPKTLPQVALRNIAKALGVREGNLSEAVIKIQNGKFQVYGVGTVFSGSAAREMTSLCKSAGMEWSIQNGALQVLPLGKAIERTALLLNSDSGMVESPTVDNKGKLQVTTLMIPGLYPGVKVQMDSRFVRGLFRVTDCEYVGDTKGNDWNIKVHAELISGNPLPVLKTSKGK